MMPEDTKSQSSINGEDNETDQTGAERSLQNDTDPQASLEKARNAAEGKSDNASGGAAPDPAQSHVPSTSDPEATDLPTAR